MDFLVAHTSHGSETSFEICGSVEDAVTVAEKLRNDEGATEIRILKTEDVRFDFKPYYQVHLDVAADSAPDSGGSGEPDPVGSGQPDPADVPEQTREEVVPAEAAATGTSDVEATVPKSRSGLFGR